jgi:hypothetical protein
MAEKLNIRINVYVCAINMDSEPKNGDTVTVVAC